MNTNTRWIDTNKKHKKLVEEYQEFLELGSFKGNGHIMVTPAELIYSRVLSLRGLRTCIYICEFKHFKFRFSVDEPHYFGVPDIHFLH